MTHFVASQRSWLLAAVATVGLIGQAQAQAEHRPAATPGTITVKLMPLALADPWAPTFRFGAEYRLSPTWGVEASYGLQVRNLGWGGTESLANNRYRKLHSEARYYFGGGPLYTALAGFVVSQRYDIGGGTLFQNAQQWQYSSAQVNRSVQAGLMKVGVVTPLFDDPHWRLDVAVGLGVRRVNVDYDLREAQPYQPLYGIMDCEPVCGFGVEVGPRTTPGTTTRPTVAVDVRIGYQLGR